MGGSLAARAVAVCAAGVVSVVAAIGVDRLAPPPTADVARGSEEAFGRGLEPREKPEGGPSQRWTRERSSFGFRHLPPGPATLVVRARNHRNPVAVAAAGVVLGTLEPGMTSRDFNLPDLTRPSLDVELRVDPFVGWGGRRLGAQLDAVTLRPSPAGLPAAALLLSFLVPALAVGCGAIVAGVAPAVAFALSATVAVLQALALAPCGLVRSGYADTLPRLLVLAALLSAGFALWSRRRIEGSGPWAFVALLAAVLVQGVAATSPLMVVSDALFHAHKLADVKMGDYFPTSVTQHARPFRFPYGVSFYLLLVPLARGTDFVGLVRGGAAVAGVLASAGLFVWLAGRGAVLAALAVLVLQLVPVTFDVYSSANLSNVFGQSVSFLFFAWWAGRAPGSWPVGAALLLLGGLAHFSCLVVLVALCAALVAMRGREVFTDRVRVLALGVGLGLAALYYLRFWRLFAEQVPRLLEGGGAADEGSAWSALLQQGMRVVAQWGLPAMLLGLAGRPRPSRGDPDRDLAAFWLAGGALLLLAVASPLEVRYLYALTLPLAVASASGFGALAARGRWGRLAAWGLLAWQSLLGVRTILADVLTRYRP